MFAAAPGTEGQSNGTSKKVEEGIIAEPEIQLDLAKLMESANPRVAAKG
jgi:hypothetical protein